MEKRSPAMEFVYTIITCGIYGIFWQVRTKNEMVAKGAEIPTAWLLIVPFANLYWLWKYSEGVEKVTSGKLSAAIVLLLFFVLGPIAIPVVQSKFNEVA
ncbi:MAG: DUF4234 domain-containing protein [Leptospiraceae bacterium]|nr:DUF4234 domain-containing protein [Leptospiraceae bacterium]